MVDSGYPKALGVVARVRLARVMLSEGEADKALSLLQVTTDISGFEALFAEVKGDIYSSQGKNDEAISLS